jgi:hypothetical protein
MGVKRWEMGDFQSKILRGETYGEETSAKSKILLGETHAEETSA